MKLTELRKIAEAATSGPWSEYLANENNKDPHSIGSDKTKQTVCFFRSNLTSIDDEGTKANAKHIATFHPALALELIGLIERAEKLSISINSVKCMAHVQDAEEMFQNISTLEEKSRSFLEALRKWEGQS